MADLIAIGYPDETTAEAAADEARQLARDLIIEPDAIAVIVRDAEGDYHVHTHHHMVGRGATWGMWWGLLFGVLFFIPVFGMAVGAGLGALMGKVTKTGIDSQFQDQVRGMLKPGTSALFLMVEKVTPDKAVEAMSKYGGTVLKTSLSKDDEKELQDALHGGERPRTLRETHRDVAVFQPYHFRHRQLSTVFATPWLASCIFHAAFVAYSGKAMRRVSIGALPSGL
jgi:uncharacterized membrane protein